jgi:hypothetical protein
MGQRDASGRDPHQHEVVGTLVRFENLVGYPRTRAGDLIGIHDQPRLH